MRPDSHLPWHLVVPVKGGSAAKSRLRAPEGVSRRALADAMAQDSVAAAIQGMPGGRVAVVTRDPHVAEWAAAAGAEVVSDPGEGLNAAVAAGISAVCGEASRADEASAAAVLLGDVPALHPADLSAALEAATAYPLAFVPDSEGTGTVLLTARCCSHLVPSFGAESAAGHEAAGHHRLDLDLPGLRTDVDDAASLAMALSLGVGPMTAALLGARTR